MLSLVFVRFLAKCSLLYSSGGAGGRTGGKGEKTGQDMGAQGRALACSQTFPEKGIEWPSDRKGVI